jgi:hypothetical protein
LAVAAWGEGAEREIMANRTSVAARRAVTACSVLVITCVSGAGGSAAAVNDTRWWATPPADGAIEGYVDQVSALPGETIDLKVSVQDGERYRIRVFRLGDRTGQVGDAELLTCIPSCDADKGGRAQEAPQIDKQSGRVRAAWVTTDRLVVDPAWGSSYLVVQFLLTSGSAAGRAAWAPLVVREVPHGRHAAILIQVPTNTAEAYNDWGGKSTYASRIAGQPATRVSFDRPYGHSLIGWEYPLVRFLENRRYDVAYQTDLDTDRDPSSLQQHRLVIVNGHDEYWTSAIRDGFERARDAGTNLLFFGANIGYWQVRYEDDGRTMVSYKATAPDPVSDPRLRTALFREFGRPECALMGIQHQGGTLLWGRSDYQVDATALADPWFADTGFVAGDRVAGVVSTETDTIPDWFAAMGKTCIDQPLKVLFRADRGGDTLGDARFTRYVTPSGAKVASVGTLELGAGVDDVFQRMSGQPSLVDPRLQRFLGNALLDLLRPAPMSAVGIVRDGLVVIRRGRLVDKRSHAEIYRVAPGRAFALGVSGVTLLSSHWGLRFTEPRKPGDRYVVVSADAWGQSLPTSVKIRRARNQS